MPLQKLSYLNVANNLIKEYRKLQPLGMIDDLEVYLVGNPFVDEEVWKNKVKNYGLKVLKEARVLQPVVVVKQEDKKGNPDSGPPQSSSSEPMPIRRSSFLFEIRARRQQRL